MRRPPEDVGAGAIALREAALVEQAGAGGDDEMVGIFGPALSPILHTLCQRATGERRQHQRNQYRSHGLFRARTREMIPAVGIQSSVLTLTIVSVIPGPAQQKPGIPQPSRLDSGLK